MLNSTIVFPTEKLTIPILVYKSCGYRVVLSLHSCIFSDRNHITELPHCNSLNKTVGMHANCNLFIFNN